MGLKAVRGHSIFAVGLDGPPYNIHNLVEMASKVPKDYGPFEFIVLSSSDDSLIEKFINEDKPYILIDQDVGNAGSLSTLADLNKVIPKVQHIIGLNWVAAIKLLTSASSISDLSSIQNVKDLLDTICILETPTSVVMNRTRQNAVIAIIHFIHAIGSILPANSEIPTAPKLTESIPKRYRWVVANMELLSADVEKALSGTDSSKQQKEFAALRPVADTNGTTSPTSPAPPAPPASSAPPASTASDPGSPGTTPAASTDAKSSILTDRIKHIFGKGYADIPAADIPESITDIIDLLKAPANILMEQKGFLTKVEVSASSSDSALGTTVKKEEEKKTDKAANESTVEEVPSPAAAAEAAEAAAAAKPIFLSNNIHGRTSLHRRLKSVDPIALLYQVAQQEYIGKFLYHARN